MATMHPSDSVPLLSRPISAGGVRPCLECGGASRSKGEFCCRACKDAFGNRRKRRGAELYDLYMAHRWERRTAQELGVLQAINRLASVFRDEDRQDRAGRRSWRRPGEVLSERPYLKAVTTRIKIGRARAVADTGGAAR